MNNYPLRFHSTALFVTDIERSKHFYTSLLGQTIDLDFGNNVILSCGVTLWQIQPDHIISQSLGKRIRPEHQCNRFELYFETPEIERIFKQLCKAGTDMLHPVHLEQWGQKTIRFFDPDRHLIEIGEPLETFIGRLYAEGMTPAQINAKTGVPLNKVNELIL